jgi:hypothetical protein
MTARTIADEYTCASGPTFSLACDSSTADYSLIYAFGLFAKDCLQEGAQK